MYFEPMMLKAEWTPLRNVRTDRYELDSIVNKWQSLLKAVIPQEVKTWVRSIRKAFTVVGTITSKVRLLLFVTTLLQPE